jgi:Raf kinase inhibitor-like YbhB/YbcL family protein
MKITSPAFSNNEKIPKKYTCDGEDVNPPLEFHDIPSNTKSLALIVDDPDAPMGTWVHWVLFNIPPTCKKIDENSIPNGACEVLNDFRKHNYGGPCPPSGIHRYFFKLYALDCELNLKGTITKRDLEKAMQGHIIAKAELIGLYSRNR